MKISDTLASEDYWEIQKLLHTLPDGNINLHQIWQLMDQVWDNLGCDNNDLDQDKITAFYKHPIWLLNGFFIEQHELSLQHRHVISNWIVQQLNDVNGNVLDFGGGFGTLARMIANKSNSIKIDIYEPYPSDFSISQCSCYPAISFVDNLNDKYDFLVSTDVLEHVPDPLELLWQMIESVNMNGYLVIANCFYPVIKCHLPSTFHFRYSFDEFAKVMGLTTIGLCEGSHATIYQKIAATSIDWKKVRQMERYSQKLYSLREFKHNNLSHWNSRLKRLVTDPLGLFTSMRKKFIRLIS
jgi:SAM-dependent methyltransferase